MYPISFSPSDIATAPLSATDTATNIKLAAAHFCNYLNFACNDSALPNIPQNGVISKAKGKDIANTLKHYEQQISSSVKEFNNIMRGLMEQNGNEVLTSGKAKKALNNKRIEPSQSTNVVEALQLVKGNVPCMRSVDQIEAVKYGKGTGSNTLNRLPLPASFSDSSPPHSVNDSQA